MLDDSSLLTGPSPDVPVGDSSPKFTKDLLAGIPLLGDQGFTNETTVPGAPSPSLKNQRLKTDPLAAHEEKVRYEFTFVFQGRLHTAVLWDYDMVSAAERVLCHPIDKDSIQQSRTGNCFLVADDGTHWAVLVESEDWAKLAVFETPTVDPSELRGHSKSKPKLLTTNAILEGLT